MPGKSTTGFNSSDLNPPGPRHSIISASVIALSISIVSLLHVSASSLTTNCGGASSKITVIDAVFLHPAAFMTVTVYSPSWVTVGLTTFSIKLFGPVHPITEPSEVTLRVP